MWKLCPLAVLLALVALPARAQPTNALPLPVAALPQPRIGQGNTSITGSTSTAINASITKTDNSPVFPTGTLTAPLTIKNQPGSANIAYICWQGGVCSAAKGEALAVGESVTENLPGQSMTTAPPTAFSVGATLVLKW